MEMSIRSSKRPHMKPRFQYFTHYQCNLFFLVFVQTRHKGKQNSVKAQSSGWPTVAVGEAAAPQDGPSIRP